MKMQFQAGVYYKGKIYFSDITGFGLFSYDLNSRRVDFCAQFEESDCFALHRKAFLYKNEGWFIPQEGRHITCVNLDNFGMQRFEVPCQKMLSNFTLCFSNGIVVNEMLVCCPHDIDTLVIVDLNKRRIRSVPGFIDPEKEKYVSLGIRDKHVWFYPLYGNHIKILDPIEGSFRSIERKDKPYEYSAVAIMERACLHVPRDHKEILYETDDEVIKCKYEGNTRIFSGCHIDGNKVLFFPLDGRDFLEVDTVTMQQQSFRAEDAAVAEDKYVLIKIDSEEGVFLSSCFTSYVLEICEDRTIKSYFIEADEKEIKKQIEMKTSEEEKRKVFEMKRESIYHEDYKSSLEGFIGFVSRKELIK